jgi:hypothetical protein
MLSEKEKKNLKKFNSDFKEGSLDDKALCLAFSFEKELF